MRVRGILIVVLSIVACARQITAVGHSGYTPKWHVGDWWIVKTWQLQPISARGDWGWVYRRYEVAGIEKVEQHDCYVLEIRVSRRPNIGPSGIVDIVVDVRTDSMLAIRQTLMTHRGSGEPLLPSVRHRPLGMFGPFTAELRLPRFPLPPVNQDTAFKREKRDDCHAYMREISGPADSALVKRLLAEGDSAGSRVVRPLGAVYEVRSEMAGGVVPGSPTGQRDVTQSLQLWSDDQPWRLYEELVD